MALTLGPQHTYSDKIEQRDWYSD